MQMEILHTALIPHRTVVFPNLIRADPSAVETESRKQTTWIYKWDFQVKNETWRKFIELLQFTSLYYI